MLETQMLELKMVGSLSQGVDSRVLEAGKWLALDNVEVDKLGAWVKRPGFAFLGYPTDIAPGASVAPRYIEALFPQVDGPRLQTPFDVGVFGPTLYSSWLEQGDDPRPPLFATWTDEAFGWEAKDTRPPFVLTRSCEVRSSHELTAGACVVLDGVLWSAYKTSDATAPRVYLRGTSIDTGDVVQDDLYFFTLMDANAWFALVVAAGRIVAVYLMQTSDAPTYAYAQADYVPSARSLSNDAFINSAPTDLTFQQFSVCNHPTDDTVYLLAAVVASGEDIQLSKRSPLTPGAPVSSALFDAGSEVLGVAICALDTSALPAGSCFLSYSRSDVTTRVVGFKDPTFTQAWSETIIDAQRWRRLDNIAVRNGSGGEDQVITSGVINSTGDDTWHRIWYQPVSALNGNTVQSPYFVAGTGALPAARAFAWRGKAYLPIVVREVGTEGYVNMHGAIYHLAETNGFEPFRAPLVACWAVNRYAQFDRFGAPILNAPALLSDEPAPTWALLAPSLANVNQTQIDRLIIEAPDDNTALLPATQAQGLAYLPGALTTVFDGQRAFEAGFLARPTLIEDSQLPSSSALEVGTYLFLAEWEHFDAKGNRHTSALAPVLTVEVEDEAKKVILAVVTESFTRRADKYDVRDNAARLVVYRTEKDSAGPFYRLTTPTALVHEDTGEHYTELFNWAAADTIPFIDESSDAEMRALGYGFYTGNLAGAIPGAVQDPGPVPPSRFLLNHKQRLFGISGDDPRTIFFSRFFVAGEAPAFPPPFAIFLSDTDEAATALGAMQDKLLIFTPSRIYYVYGEGPDDAGGGAGFSEPALCSDSIGCVEPRSLAVTPIGLVFQASDDGIYVIDGGLSPQRVSGAVEDYLARGKVKSVHVDTARGTVTWALTETVNNTDQSTLLQFSYWASIWTRWVLDPSQARGNAGACLWKGQHIVAEHYEAASSTFGMVAIESTDRRDRSKNTLVMTSYQAGFHGVVPRVQTPWLRLAGLNGFQRVRRLQLRGVTNGSIGVGGEIVITVQHDEEDFGGQVFTYDLSTVTRLPVLALAGHIARQKCASVRVTIDVADEGGGVGTTLTALALEMGGLKGFTKLPRTNKAAGGGSLWAKRATRHRAQLAVVSREQRSAPPFSLAGGR